jgi:hypothetical protein
MPEPGEGCASMSGDGFAGEAEDGFGEGKLQHDLAFIVSHFESRIQKAALRTFGLQQFMDHCLRNFPCAVGIPQLFAFGIGNQIIADTGVEKVPRHK